MQPDECGDKYRFVKLLPKAKQLNYYFYKYLYFNINKLLFL